MSPLPPELRRLANALRPIFRRHRVVRAILFGSLARGEGTRRSDVDLIIIQNTRKRFLDRYDGLLQEISERVPGRDVDLLIYTPQEIAGLAHRPLIASALKEGKTIYESQQESL